MPRSSEKSKKGISLVSFVLLFGLWLNPQVIGSTSHLPSVAQPLVDMNIPNSVDNSIDSLIRQLNRERIELIKNKQILEKQQDTIKYGL